MTQIKGYYEARRMVNNRPIGEVLARGTAEEVDPFWVAGQVAIVWTYDAPPPRQLSQKSLASVRRKRLRNRLEKKCPLLASVLYEQELAARPAHYAGERANTPNPSKENTMTTEKNTPDMMEQIIAEHDELTQQPPHFTGKDWQGRSVILTHKETEEPVRRSHSHEDYRGNYTHIRDARPPHKEGASGYVYTADGSQLYASVFNMQWSKA